MPSYNGLMPAGRCQSQLSFIWGNVVISFWRSIHVASHHMLKRAEAATKGPPANSIGMFLFVIQRPVMLSMHYYATEFSPETQCPSEFYLRHIKERLLLVTV